MRKGSYDAHLTHRDANVLIDFYQKKSLIYGHSTELHQCFSTLQERPSPKKKEQKKGEPLFYDGYY